MTLTKHSRIPIYLKWSSDLDKPPAEHRGNQTAKSYSPEFEKDLPIKKTCLHLNPWLSCLCCPNDVGAHQFVPFTIKSV